MQCDTLPGEHETGSADQHNGDFAGLDDADQQGLVAHVRQLPGQRREQEERNDENGRGQSAEAGFLCLGIIDLVHDVEDHRVLEQIVVERPEELGDEQGQEASRPYQLGRGHVGL